MFVNLTLQSGLLSTLNSSKIFTLKAPEKLSNCKAKLDDGSIVDLTSQDKSSSPRLIFKINILFAKY